MKKVGLFLATFLFAVFAAKAQPPQGEGGQRRQFTPEDMAKRQTEQMKEYIKLSKDEEKKVNEINLKYAKKSQELREGVSFRDMTDKQREEMRTKMEAQQEEKDKELKKIFSADQWKQYEKYKEEARARRGPGGQGGPGGQRGDRQ